MTERPTWRDAERFATEIFEQRNERQILDLLTYLPLSSASVLAPFTGHRSTLYRALGNLRGLGLVAGIRPSPRPGHAPRLWYLTDLGLAVVSLYQKTTAQQFVRSRRLRGVDLLGLFPALTQVLAAYDFLAGIAASCLDRPRLLAWERPWRRRYVGPGANGPRRISFPACCVLSSNDSTRAYLLLPDLETSPPRAWRTALARLVTLRATQPGGIPQLLIATTDSRRATIWRDLIDEVALSRREAPLPGGVLLWSELPSGFGLIVPGSGSDVGRESLDGQPSGRAPVLARASGHVPRLIDGAFRPAVEPTKVKPNLGRIAQSLTVADWALLDLVGRHPFLDPKQIQQVCDLHVTRAKGGLRRLITAGLLRRCTPDDVDASAIGPGLIELTRSGLAIVAAQQGLNLSQAVRYNGLVGGGPERPVGARHTLARNLAHTRGVDALFVGLARQLARLGDNSALVEWRNATACARRYVRPDGYGIVRYHGTLHGFFLEYDRGTMRIPGYLKKLASYYAYQNSGRFQRDYAGFPTVLVVAVSNAAEERIARAARVAAIGRAVPLPVLLTVQWRIEDDCNPDGLLGPIWRPPDTEFFDRRPWPLNPAARPLTPPLHPL